jgi:hypothetical protein
MDSLDGGPSRALLGRTLAALAAAQRSSGARRCFAQNRAAGPEVLVRSEVHVVCSATTGFDPRPMAPAYKIGKARSDVGGAQNVRSDRFRQRRSANSRRRRTPVSRPGADRQRGRPCLVPPPRRLNAFARPAGTAGHVDKGVRHTALADRSEARQRQLSRPGEVPQRFASISVRRGLSSDSVEPVHKQGVVVRELSDDQRHALRAEFEIEDGTFLEKALGGTWDEAGFGRLARLMRLGCVAYQEREIVEKWVAAGYHHLDTQLDRYLPPSLGLEDEFVDDVREHLMLLASWFFSGQCPFEDPDRFEDELVALLARGSTV